MALVKCPDCGKKISDTAPSCIGCGRPMVTNQESLDLSSYKLNEKRSKIPESGIQEVEDLSKSEVESQSNSGKRIGPPKAFSWKSFLVAVLITFILYVLMCIAVNPESAPKGFYWTLMWMLLTVEGWKYWKWKSLIPYPAYLLCYLLVSIIILVFGGEISDAHIVGSLLNIVGLVIFAIIYYRRFNKEIRDIAQQTALGDRVPQRQDSNVEAERIEND